jgi:hypothetical protein
MADEANSTPIKPSVLIVDCGSGQYPEDGITLLERWANVDPANNPNLGSITKTTASISLSTLMHPAPSKDVGGDVHSG